MGRLADGVDAMRGAEAVASVVASTTARKRLFAPDSAPVAGDGHCDPLAVPLAHRDEEEQKEEEEEE